MEYFSTKIWKNSLTLILACSVLIETQVIEVTGLCSELFGERADEKNTIHICTRSYTNTIEAVYFDLVDAPTEKTTSCYCTMTFEKSGTNYIWLQLSWKHRINEVLLVPQVGLGVPFQTSSLSFSGVSLKQINKLNFTVTATEKPMNACLVIHKSESESSPFQVECYSTVEGRVASTTKIPDQRNSSYKTVKEVSASKSIPITVRTDTTANSRTSVISASTTLSTMQTNQKTSSAGPSGSTSLLPEDTPNKSPSGGISGFVIGLIVGGILVLLIVSTVFAVIRVKRNTKHRDDQLTRTAYERGARQIIQESVNYYSGITYSDNNTRHEATRSAVDDTKNVEYVNSDVINKQTGKPKKQYYVNVQSSVSEASYSNCNDNLENRITNSVYNNIISELEVKPEQYILQYNLN